MTKKKPVCPKCNMKYDGYPAISRIDNKTEICQTCGLKEALNDFLEYRKEQEADFYEDEEYIAPEWDVPRQKELDDYMLNTIIYNFIAFYIDLNFRYHPAYCSSLKMSINTAIEELGCIHYRDDIDEKIVKKVLKDKYSLVIVSDEPFEVKRI